MYYSVDQMQDIGFPWHSYSPCLVLCYCSIVRLRTCSSQHSFGAYEACSKSLAMVLFTCLAIYTVTILSIIYNVIVSYNEAIFCMMYKHIFYTVLAYLLFTNGPSLHIVIYKQNLFSSVMFTIS